MSYANFDTQKICEFCKGEFSTKNSRDRYCPECVSRMYDIKRVVGTKSPSQATEEERRRILERVGVGRTTRQGPFNYIKK